jgi:hypothetical protein
MFKDLQKRKIRLYGNKKKFSKVFRRISNYIKAPSTFKMTMF